MSPERILATWEARWGSLSPEMRERFLERDEVDQLQQFSVEVVQEAIGKNQRLVNALGEARVLGHWSEPAPKRRSGGPMIRNPQTGRGS